MIVLSIFCSAKERCKNVSPEYFKYRDVHNNGNWNCNIVWAKTEQNRNSRLPDIWSSVVSSMIEMRA